VHVHDVIPILNVSDLSASFTWFEKLGFQKAWEWCPPGSVRPDFGAVRGGDCEIFLCLDGQGVRSDAGERSGAGVWLAIWVDDVDAVHAKCLSEQIEVLEAPENKPWGVRESLIRHPDGHAFRISQGAAHDHDHPHDDHDHDH